jgi:Rieske Fe-S protein
MKSSNKLELTVIEERRAFLGKCMTALAGISIVGVVAPFVEACQPAQPIGPRVLPPVDNGPGTDTTGSTDPNVPPGVPFDVSALDADGKALITTRVGSDGMPVLLVRLSATDYRALSSLCTHAHCKVDTKVPVNGPINCSCHGSQFQLDGTVKKGPATDPLKSYTATLFGTPAKLYVVIT